MMMMNCAPAGRHVSARQEAMSLRLGARKCIVRERLSEGGVNMKGDTQNMIPARSMIRTRRPPSFRNSPILYRRGNCWARTFLGDFVTYAVQFLLCVPSGGLTAGGAGGRTVGNGQGKEAPLVGADP